MLGIKKKLWTLMMLFAVLLMSGCIKVDYHLILNNDDTLTLEVVMLEKVDIYEIERNQISEEEVKENLSLSIEESKFDEVEFIRDGDYVGYKTVRTFSNINELKNEGDRFFRNLYLETDFGDSNQIEFDLHINVNYLLLTNFEDLDNEFTAEIPQESLENIDPHLIFDSFTFSLTSPYPLRYHNADIEIGNTTYQWDIDLTKGNSLKASNITSSQFSTNLMYFLIIPLAFIAITTVVIICIKKVK